MTKDGEEGPLETQKKKKHKTSKPVLKTTLTEDDYELIATRTCDTLKDSFDAVKTSQEKIQSTVEKQLLDLKTITEKTTMMHIPSVKATTAETSTPSMSREESLATDHLNIVLIPPGSIRFPGKMKDPPIQFRQPIEVNLVEFYIDQLQMIQQQLSIELRDRELATYKQNTQLRQKNPELTTSFQKKEKELRKYQEREQDLS